MNRLPYTAAPVFCVVMSVCVWGGDQLHISPSKIRLAGPEASQQLIVTRVTDNRRRDVTRDVEYECDDPGLLKISASGRLSPLSDGETTITVRDGDADAKVDVTITRYADPVPMSFGHEVVPILSKAGCNSGGCHGKAEGQNGFKLSVFGFDPASDFDALTREGRGRRISVSSPASSLLLAKATGQAPHGGGQRIAPESLWHRRLARWISEGAPFDAVATSDLVGIEVEPASVMMQRDSSQQLRVTAIDSEGRRRCVTAEAQYESNAETIAGVDSSGLVSVSEVPGEAAILVRYMEQVAVCRVTLPQSTDSFQRPTEFNFIDRLAFDKLQRLGIQPSEICDDATFLRRAHLDTIGRLPSVDQTRAFLNDPSADKRRRLVDQLLEREEYAGFWAMRWADILRVDKAIVTPQGAVAMTRWIRKQFSENTPYDQFAREVVTARGNTLAESPAGFFTVHKDAEKAARAISQVFLGVRLECAQCHHHPAEKWGQNDYYAFANLFADFGLVKSNTGGQKVVWQTAKPLPHPRTGAEVPAATLGSQPIVSDETTDRREQLADWITAPENPYFSRMIANRMWAHYFGRGLVEPIDDMRATNPATNEPLLDALADHLRDVDYDLKRFTKTILNSRTYQLASAVNESNRHDAQNYSRAAWKTLSAEVLLDAMCDVTGVPQRFNGWPLGTRAIEVWDNRMPSYFFRIFGRPQRVTVCECERGNEPSVAQALHLMNSDETVQKVRHRDGLAASLASSSLADGEVIEQLFLATLCRYPTEKETALMTQAFVESTDRRSATEDILWALLNTREFAYNH